MDEKEEPFEPCKPTCWYCTMDQWKFTAWFNLHAAEELFKFRTEWDPTIRF